MNPAPIVLFCYNRPQHLARTLHSLQQNEEAARSTLYVFSDGPKGEKDVDAVAAVRTVLRQVTGFAAVVLDENPTNRGLAESVIRGVTQVLEKHNRAIVLEDDLAFAPDFLTFMNQALDTYERRADIFSISGYLYPIPIPADYTADVLLLPRASSWGWATWLDRWKKADWQVTHFQELAQHPAARRALTRGGDDLWPMLQKQQRGLVSSWAVRWSLTHAEHGAYGLYPTVSKVQNTGADGSGTHTGSTRRFEVELGEKNLKLSPDIQPDSRLARNLRAYFRPSLVRRLINWIRL